MKRVHICWRCLRTALAKIHLVDRCLILFMLVLLLQSAYSMFFHTGDGTTVGDIDIIVRTSSAAIFGYFLSANFIRHAASNQSASSDSPTESPAAELEMGGSAQTDGPRNRIGFAVGGQPQELERQNASGAPSKTPPTDADSCSRLQVIVATCIGLFCLVSLLLMRNVVQLNVPPAAYQSIAATVAQFRDFVSGCVGFLIGCPTHGSGPIKS